ncbi:hypothetical protein NEILACOT_04497 [Neisseria lactamica ATCC 23970]|uniref:Uncharacterized protein n=1 Tax=Neisseria lactamica ATCC 23970 TaxID=546265 RepID=D0WAC8_NEILA|nr:hypothetical protein NEILACOT_04996 [Neisseria lactamica ATCC 23970]EEZ75527.1 hypothetical protein NEILACOT_04497 [Neisseria lactamica ATCC 23970]
MSSVLYLNGFISPSWYISHRLSGNITPFVVLFDTVCRAIQHRLSGNSTPFCRYIAPFSVQD